MELKPGYKQTAVGLIPNNWQVVPLSELMDFRNGVNADKQAYGRGIPFINVLEIITKGHLRASDVPGRVSISKSAAESYSVRHGDLVFNRTSETQEEVGLSAVYVDNAPAVFGGFVIRGRPKIKAIDATYSGYAFRSSSIHSQIVARGQGAIRSNIGQADLRQVLAVLPPLPEQRAIAAVLSDVDTLLAKLDQLIAKKRDIKQAAMQQLLTGKKRLPGFQVKPGYKQTEVGAIPKDWHLDAIVNLASITTGDKNTQDNVKGGIYPFFVRSSIVERINSFSYEGEAVLTAGDGVGTGKIFHYINGKFDFHQRVYKISNFDACLGGYFFYLYFSDNFYSRIMQMTAKSSVDSVRREMIANMKIPIPCVEEQRAVASVLSDMDAEIAALEARRDKTRALKQGMMQELLTGRIRLI